MKLISFITALFFFPYFILAQVGIGTTSPAASAKLEISSTNKGFLPPRMTESQKNAISSPATGLLVFQTDGSSGYYYYDGGKWSQLIVTQPDATISFDQATPTTAQVVFTPNIQNSTNYIYVSSVNNNQWTYNGTAYVTYTPPKSTAWYSANSTNDAGANKDSAIYRKGKVGIGASAPTATLEVGSADGTISGEIKINPATTGDEGGQVLLKKSANPISGSTQDWTIDQVSNASTPRFRIFPGTDETKGIAIGETGYVSIGGNTIGQTDKLYVNGSTKINGNLNAKGASFVVAGLYSDQSLSYNADHVIGLSAVSDLNSWWDATNYRFKPTVAGYYYVSAMVNWKQGTTTTAGSQLNIQIRKGGGTGSGYGTVAICQNEINTTMTFTQRATAIVYLNGTSDYIDLTGYTNNSTSQTITGSTDYAWTKLEAYKIN